VFSRRGTSSDLAGSDAGPPSGAGADCMHKSKRKARSSLRHSGSAAYVEQEDRCIIRDDTSGGYAVPPLIRGHVFIQ
jgi:hypothetical protein